MNRLLFSALALAGLTALAWLGLKVKPRSFPPYPEKSPSLTTVPLPAGLPAPVERYYLTVYDERVPVVESVVIKGRATISSRWRTFPRDLPTPTAPNRAQL